MKKSVVPTGRKSKFVASGELPPLRKLEEDGSKVIGYFQSYRIVTMIDRKTKVSKDVRFYTFRDETDSTKRFAISGRAQLDVAFDHVAEMAGSYENLAGELVEVRRGKSRKLPGDKTLNNYEVEVFETE